MNFGLEPNVQLDEMADYISHLHRLRRVNLGDDNADSAGYGLYLLRVPVSIEPGDHTKKGFGAIINLTVRHDFNPRFLQTTYRNLVIYDLVDLLAPVVHELIRSGQAQNYQAALQTYWSDPTKKTSPTLAELNIKRPLLETTRLQTPSRPGQRIYAIAPSDVKRVFVAQNLLNLAFAAQQALGLGNSKAPDTWTVRATDVRTFLLHELESAYDLMEGRCREQPPLLQDVEYVENLTDQVYCRKFEGPKGVQVDSRMRSSTSSTTSTRASRTGYRAISRFRPIGVLCWGIVIQAGLLNRQLREDMKQTRRGWTGTLARPRSNPCSSIPPSRRRTRRLSSRSMSRRWPMITFALEPTIDQQNIDDAYTRRRDLQLALAFALSSGRVSFRQALNYNADSCNTRPRPSR